MTRSSQISRSGRRFRQFALAMAICLAPTITRLRAAEEPPVRKETDQLVVPRYRNFSLRESETGPGRPASFVIYRIVKVNERSLFLAPEVGPGGWVDASQVVPLQDALAWFSDAIRRVPIEPHNYEMRAMLLLFRQGDTKHALADCEKAIRLDPQYGYSYRIRGAVRLVNHQLDEALADLSRVVRLMPNDPVA